MGTKMTGGRRIGASLGAVAVILGSVGTAMYPADMPEFPAEGEATATWISANTDTLVSIGWLYFLTAVLMTFFWGALRSQLGAWEKGDGWLSMTAFGAGVGTIAMMTLAAGAQMLAAVRADADAGLSGELAAVYWDLNYYAWGVFGAVLLSAALLAAGACMWKYRAYPAWWGALTMLAGVALFLAPMASAWMMLVGLGWMMVMSIWMAFGSVWPSEVAATGSGAGSSSASERTAAAV